MRLTLHWQYDGATNIFPHWRKRLACTLTNTTRFLITEPIEAVIKRRNTSMLTAIVVETNRYDILFHFSQNPALFNA